MKFLKKILNKDPYVIEDSYYMLDANKNLVKNQSIQAYWWDGRKNFGDWIGPWLIAEITGKTIINIRNKRSKDAIFSVGSIIEHISKNNVDSYVWGSGLIQPINLQIPTFNVKSIKKICAVRGMLTYKELTSKLNLDVPEIFGDPALLLPKFHSPSLKYVIDKPTVCPHYIHYDHFNNSDILDNFHLINVQEDPLDVINQIASSPLCISSSLHGIIIAQSYGVPWVWIQIEDNPLFGVDFKFYDFLSTCNYSKIPLYKLRRDDIKYSVLMNLKKNATVLDLNINLNDLLDAFPYEGSL